MEAHIRTPEPLKNGKMDVNWRKWKNEFIIFMKASGIFKKPDDEKAYLLLILIGDIGKQAYKNFTFENPSDKYKIDVLLKKFDEEFDPPKQETEERYIFFTRSQKNDESIEAYIGELQELAKTCNFGDLKDSLVRDRIILDTKDNILRKKYLDTKDLTLEKMVHIYKDYGSTMEKMKLISSTSNQVNKTVRIKDCLKCGTDHIPSQCPAFGKVCERCGNINHFSSKCVVPMIKDCPRCGTEHIKSACPAIGTLCNKCNKPNHYEDKCMTKNTTP